MRHFGKILAATLILTLLAVSVRSEDYPVYLTQSDYEQNLNHRAIQHVFPYSGEIADQKNLNYLSNAPSRYYREPWAGGEANNVMFGDGLQGAKTPFYGQIQAPNTLVVVGVLAVIVAVIIFLNLYD